MQEIELKFQVPAHRLAAVQAALLALPGADVHPLAMHAAYFDTPDNRLAGQKMALRVRREGALWVQTFKAGGADVMTRLEDNQALPPTGPAFRDGRPVADVSLHRDAAVQAALARALPTANHPPEALAVVYDTVFDRHTAVLKGAHGAVQLCLDLGAVRAGKLSETLAELEFELLEGRPLAVIDAARQWVHIHGLWLDVQSKAYRGTRLAQAARADGQVPCRPVALTELPPAPDRAAPDWTRAVLNATLESATGNLSEVAWARSGWDQAAHAWLAALARLHRLAADHPGLKAGLTEHTWATGSTLMDALIEAGTRQAAMPATGSAEALAPAQAVAQGPAATHWALDVLQAIVASRSP